MSDPKIFHMTEVVKAVCNLLNPLDAEMGLSSIQAGDLMQMQFPGFTPTLDAILVCPIKATGDLSGQPLGEPLPTEAAGEVYWLRVIYARKIVSAEHARLEMIADTDRIGDRLSSNPELAGGLGIPNTCVMESCWPTEVDYSPPERQRMNPSLVETVDMTAITVRVKTRSNRFGV